MIDQWLKAYDINDHTYYTFQLKDVTALTHHVADTDAASDTYGVRIMVDVFEQDVVEIELSQEQYEAISDKLSIETLPGYEDVSVKDDKHESL